MNEREKKAGTTPAASASSERREVAVVKMVGGGTGGSLKKMHVKFNFDEVLTSFSDQGEVFAATLDPLVDEVLAGFEATAFAYGQTGTGKTYTMEGDLDSDDGRGLVPRTAAAVIDRLASGGYTGYSVSCSYLEIYNEELSDLLAPAHHQPRLDLKDSGGGKGVLCTGLSEVPVQSLSDILDLVRRAQERRRVAETRINARSSRSHCIFTLKVQCWKSVAQGELHNSGKLHLVDLAGSECAKKASGSDDTSASSTSISRSVQASNQDEDRERKNINQSLLTLGRVISALRDGSGRVPYRDSKLTRLLQDALGGRCKTVVIATISPALNAVEETMSTLTYAEQASGVKNRPLATSLLRSIRLANAPGSLAAIGGDGGGAGTGCSSDFAEMEMKLAYLSQEVEEAQAKLAKEYRETQEQLERANLAEQKLTEAERQLAAALRAGEEKDFAITRLASFADDRCDAAARLDRALVASAAHGEDLRRLAADAAAQTVASRKQLRDLCQAAAARGEELAAKTRARVRELAASADEIHRAHRDGMHVFASLTKEQKNILTSFHSVAQSCGQRLEADLAALTAEAEASLEEAEAASQQALASISAALSEATGAAARGAEEVGAEAAHGEAVVEQHGAQLRATLADGRGALSEGSRAAAEGAEAAQVAASQEQEALMGRLRSTVEEPLSGLGASLVAASDGLGRHGAAVAALQADEAKNASECAERWRRLLQELGASAEAHSSTSAAGQAAIREALGSLSAALGSRGEASSAALASLLDGLGRASRGLAAATDRGRGAVRGAVEEADGLLAAGWDAELKALEDMGATLTRAAAEQRSANVGEALRADAAQASLQLTGTLAASVASLAATRDDIASQVMELQEQRAAEQETVGILARQREALQTDVSALRETLQAVQEELNSGRGRLDAMLAAQESARARVLEAVSSSLRSELSALGAELGSAVAATSEQLLAGQRRAEDARAAATAAEERGAEASRQAAQVVAAWSQGIDGKCCAIEAAQERAREAAQSVEAASAEAAGGLRRMEEASSTWGSRCEEVAGLVDAAEAARGRLAEDVAALAPSWQRRRSQAEEAADAWAQDGRGVGEALAATAADGAAGKAELESLREEVGEQHRAAEAVVAAWEKDAKAHGQALAEATELGGGFAEASETAAARRKAAVEGLRGEAADLEANAAQHCANRDNISAAVAAELAALPPTFLASSRALAAATAACTSLAEAGASAFDAAGERAAALQAAQASSSAAVRAGVASAAEAVGEAARRGLAAEETQRRAAEASADRSRGHWRRAAGEQREALQALSTAGEEVQERSNTATRNGSDGVLKELNRGEKAKAATAEAIEQLTTGIASSLSAHASSLHSALASPPLDAFNTAPAAAVPARPEAASRPGGLELGPRPSEAQLAAEFRGGGGRGSPLESSVVDGANKENAPAPRQAKINADSRGPALVDKAQPHPQPQQPPAGRGRQVLGERVAPGTA